MLRTFKRWLHRPKTTTVALEALCVLWVHDSATLKPFMKEDEQDAVRWINTDINSFYRTYVQPFSAAMGPSRGVVEQILTMLDHQGNVPSVANNETSDQRLAQITLREHSLNVAREAVDMLKKHHKDYEMMMGRILIIALGHDLGLCSKAQLFDSVSTKSLLILEPMIQDLPFKEIIFEAISSFNKSNPKSQEARILRAAEAATRKKELMRIQLLSSTPGVPIDVRKVQEMVREEES